MVPLGIQLHTVRESAAEDYAAVLARVAEIGYKGVETANLYGHTPAEVGGMIADLGLTPIAAHIGPAIPYSVSELVDMAGGLSADTIVCAVWKQADWTSMDAIEEVAAGMQDVALQLKPHGIRLAYHNHGYEMPVVDGKTALEHFYAAAPDVLAEIDIYWAADWGKIDVPALVSKLAGQVALLHLKDGPLDPAERRMLSAVGAGKLAIPPIVAAADPAVLEWNIVEIDNTPGDTWEAVKASHDYCVAAGLAG